jgi:DNA-binding NarL/FixJ family response regulator
MKSSEKMRVLLVEDTVIVAEQVRDLLQQSLHDPEIMFASTEDEAVETANQYEPHVVILDLKLKQGTGFGVLRTLCESEVRPLFIVLTNYALPQYREFAKLIGADFFLDKALDFTTITEILDSIPIFDRNPPKITKH